MGWPKIGQFEWEWGELSGIECSIVSQNQVDIRQFDQGYETNVEK